MPKNKYKPNLPDILVSLAMFALCIIAMFLASCSAPVVDDGAYYPETPLVCSSTPQNQCAAIKTDIFVGF